MWMVMIASYTIVSLIDTKKFSYFNDKKELLVYVLLMSVSCAIGISNGYIKNVPSPAVPIRDFILSIFGS